MNLFKLMATISLDSKEYERGINKAEGSTTNFAGIFKKLAIGTAVGSIGKKSIEMGMDFESSMSQVAATMGMTKKDIENGSESFKLLEKSAKEAGSTTQFSATESAEALNYLALAGNDAETSVKLLPKVLNLAAAGGMDLASASDMVTDSMSALGLETKDADNFINQMAKTSQKSNTNVSQLGEAILTVGGTAKVLKGGTAELNTQLGILADNGIKGAEGGTALRNMILSLSSPTDKAAKLMKDLGLEVFDAGGNMRSTNDIFMDLDRILGTMTAEQKTNVLSELFNKVDLKSANALLAGSGQRFNELSDEIINSENAASNMAETMNNNLKGAITTLKSSLEGMGIAIYEKFKGPLTDAVESVTKVIQGLITALESGDLDGLLMLVAAAIGAVVTNMLVMKGIAIVSTIASFAGSLIKAASMVKSLSGAMAILNAVMLANPIGLIVGLIGALVGAFLYLWTTNDGFRDAVTKAWNWIKQVAQDVWGGIVNFFTETIPNAIQSMMEWFSQLPTRISEWFTQAKETISNWASETWQKAVEAGSNFIKSVIEWFQQLPYNIGFFIGESMAKLAIWATETWEKAKEMGSNFISAVVEWFQQLPTRISEFITESLNKVKTWSSEMWNKAKEMGSNFINGAIDWFKQLPGKISQWLRNTIDKVRAWVQDMKSKAKEAASEFTKWLIDGIKDLPNKFANIGSDIIKGVWNGILNMKEWLMSKVSNFFSGMLDGVKSVFGIHSPSRAFRDEVGKWIPAGVAVGIEGGMPDLEKTLNTEMGGLIDIAEPTGFTLMNNRNDEIIGLLKQLVAKDTVLEMEGREVARSIAPYQNELQEYSRLVTI